MNVRVISNAACKLGEGPLWSDDRLWWFDIDGRRLHSCGPEGEAPRTWDFDEPHSAAARVAGGGMLIASASGLWRFDPESGARDLVTPLEASHHWEKSNG